MQKLFIACLTVLFLFGCGDGESKWPWSSEKKADQEVSIEEQKEKTQVQVLKEEKRTLVLDNAQAKIKLLEQANQKLTEQNELLNKRVTVLEAFAENQPGDFQAAKPDNFADALKKHTEKHFTDFYNIMIHVMVGIIFFIGFRIMMKNKMKFLSVLSLLCGLITIAPLGLIVHEISQTMSWFGGVGILFTIVGLVFGEQIKSLFKDNDDEKDGK